MRGPSKRPWCPPIYYHSLDLLPYSDFDCFSGNLSHPSPTLCPILPPPPSPPAKRKVPLVVDSYGKYNLRTCSRKINPAFSVPAVSYSSQVFPGRTLTQWHTLFSLGLVNIFQSSLNFIFQWHHTKQGNRREGDGSAHACVFLLWFPPPSISSTGGGGRRPATCVLTRPFQIPIHAQV